MSCTLSLINCLQGVLCAVIVGGAVCVCVCVCTVHVCVLRIMAWVYALNLVHLSIHVRACANEFPVCARQLNTLTRQYELMRLSLWCLPTVK